MKTMILIPTLDPNDDLIAYIKKLNTYNLGRIIIVNDGSGAKYNSIFNSLKKIENCVVLTHNINKGKGIALKTGFEYFLKMDDIDDYSGIISADSDGQHGIDDIIRISSILVDKKQLILGVRDFTKREVPPKSRFGNNLTKSIMKILYKVKISDTQTGLRAFPKCMIAELLQCNGERYEYEMNMLIMCAKNDVPILETQIETIYYDSNSETHFNPIKDSVRIYKFFFGTFVKYIFSSLSASVIDILIYTILLRTIFTVNTQYIFIATVIARAISSFYNFMINRKVVFVSKNGFICETFKYYILVCIQMLCSATVVSLVTIAFPQMLSLNKIIVDTALFFCNYYVQKKFIFKTK